MASPSGKKSLSARGRDRISGLPDDVLGHALSFLPTKEAARAAALARRWRHVFGSVHAISFEEEAGARTKDFDDTYYYEAEERKSGNDVLLDGVGAALLCRRRCAGARRVPLRSFRFAFNNWHQWDNVAVDQWLAYVLPRRDSHSHPGLDLDLCFHIGPVICALNDRDRRRDGGSDSDDDARCNMWTYVLPRRLFSCTALRTLCLTDCRLKLPRINVIDLPFLETMRLTALGDSGRSIQRLISSCPRLADLTLEALWKLKRVTILNKRLRRFALRCCHNLKSVDIDASELRSIEYRGRCPAKSLLCLHGSPVTIPLCTIVFCKPLSEEPEFGNFTRFLKEISNVKQLHLNHGSLGSRFLGFPLLSGLTRLTLRGCIGSCSTIVAVRRILEQTPNLEVLSLLLWELDWWGVVPSEITIPDKRSFSLPCLRLRVREVSVEGYKGSEPEKMLARLLLQNMLVLEKLHVVFADGLESELKNTLEEQMEKWGVANSEKIFTSL